jgi:hypothetical protein
MGMRRRQDVLIAMAAPSCVVTGFRPIDDYAAVEALIARQRAEAWKLDPFEILDEAKRRVEATEQSILAIAEQLAAHGWVDAPELSG